MTCTVVYEVMPIATIPLFDDSLQHTQPKVFNSFLRELKEELLGTRYSSFWSVKMVEEGVTLVDSSECAASTLTSQEAKEVGTMYVHVR